MSDEYEAQRKELKRLKKDLKSATRKDGELLLGPPSSPLSTTATSKLNNNSVENQPSSIAAPGSGAFHLYKIEKRKRLERQDIENKEAEIEEKNKEFEEKRKLLQDQDLAKTEKNRLKRRKRKGKPDTKPKPSDS